MTELFAGWSSLEIRFRRYLVSLDVTIPSLLVCTESKNVSGVYVQPACVVVSFWHPSAFLPPTRVGCFFGVSRLLPYSELISSEF